MNKVSYLIVDLSNDDVERAKEVKEVHDLFDLYGWRGNKEEKWWSVANASRKPQDRDVPRTRIHKDENGVVDGTVSLIPIDGDFELSPWVGGNAVREDKQHLGLGTALMADIIAYATTLADQGAQTHQEELLIKGRTIYLVTERTVRESQPEWYESLGWQFYDPPTKYRDTEIVMFYVLPN